jgi:DNA-binding transcriptional MerR regulator
MTLLTAREAATLLGVTQETLRVWEARFGYPEPVAFPSGRPGYAYADVVALRNALDRQLSISTAIGAARRSVSVGA